MKTRKLISTLCAVVLSASAMAQNFELTSSGYFRNHGVDVMAFDDIYPEGHQGGVSVIMHGHRVATNGDLRLEATPGQWQPVPRQLSRKAEGNSITATLCYPDSSRHETGFNPIFYPELQLQYTVRVEAKDDRIDVIVDLDQPIPDYLIGKAGFNLEFFPGSLFGKPWLMDRQSGIYPQQPNSPLLTAQPNNAHLGTYHQEGKSFADINQFIGGDGYSPIVADDIIAMPYAVGKKFTSRPDEPLSKLTVESLNGELKLFDGRMNHNNGWFVLRQEIKAGATREAVHWVITPTVVKDWTYTPVVQTSQIGYHPSQPKTAVIETMSSSPLAPSAQLVRIDADKEQVVKDIALKQWGHFLRYDYLLADFSDVKMPGLYQVRYAGATSSVFRIAPDIYSRGVWQPVIEYFLPVQMCHMRVNEKYRVWHDRCHMDDALMAKAGNLFDGYDQKAENIPAAIPSGTEVPNLNVGGWHDAGDFDLRIESQAGEAYILSLAYEAFKPQIDVTSIDQQRHVTEIHQADGKNDMLQQIENGALTVVNGYLSLGRLYRGIICSKLRQYCLLGDASAMTDNVKGNDDDRWVFTENNPMRELSTAAELAAVARTMRGFNDTLSVHCQNIAEAIYDGFADSKNPMITGSRIAVAAELYLTTKNRTYLDYLFRNQDAIMKNMGSMAWRLARIEQLCAGMKGDRKAQKFSAAFRKALVPMSKGIASRAAETPYGIPYRPHIWGAGWDIQRFGFENYFLTAAYPELFPASNVYNALNFVLGCHPGVNRASFASGVGAESATVGYGLNRADWSYIPGGVISGTALIRPDFPELLTFPFLWQQTEYVLGGGSSHYMFLVLAAQKLLMPKFEFKKNPEKIYTVKSGNTVMKIDANNGARITSYTLNGKEVLSQINVPNQYGSTFWTSPQKEWNWPPVPEHDMMPYSVEQKGGAIIMTSQLSKKLPFIIRKTFKSDKTGGIDVTYTVINKSDEERKVAPWEITRVLADGSVMFDAPLESITPKGLMKFYKEGNHVRYDIDHVDGKNRKINADGKGGLTFVNKDLRLMKKFADLTPDQSAPDEAEIQVYVHQGNAYVELESQGAYTTLKPGEQLDWTVNWRMEANK